MNRINRTVYSWRFADCEQLAYDMACDLLLQTDFKRISELSFSNVVTEFQMFLQGHDIPTDQPSSQHLAEQWRSLSNQELATLLAFKLFEASHFTRTTMLYEQPIADVLNQAFECLKSIRFYDIHYTEQPEVKPKSKPFR